ncbi:Serine/threonine protein kinase [Handroanthus impetiginosus]|uniref:non-specific serine/threonine protein kinase n=1 Tax=Handroanthus impetiginosus TaxID=429701 RepID=A0A2G9HP14_9LAMI|nr:Serine/threonine protein kinase [Handroanthus impetiginosus]
MSSLAPPPEAPTYRFPWLFSPPSPTDSPPSPPSFNPRSQWPPSPPFPRIPPVPSSPLGISPGAWARIVVGAVLILKILILLFAYYKKKRRRQSDYPPPPSAPRGNQFYQNFFLLSERYRLININFRYSARCPSKMMADYQGGLVQNCQQNAPPPPNHVITVPPKPSPPPAGASRPPYYSSGSGFSMSTFTYEDLAAATDGFSKANLLGQGGFGYVHKGILPNGKEVAIKQLKGGSGQGECEFRAEVEIISRVHHKHLVSLAGYYITGTQRMLVYEFAPNKTLEFHLHGKGRTIMDWSAQLKIALGATKGLAYLHEDCHSKFIHRDIKLSNILLDFNFEAKVADFGLAKFTSDADTIMYLAPEYASSGKLSEKSYGAARPLPTQALEDGNFDNIVNQRIKNDHNQNEMARMVACAAACVRHSAKRRPRMNQVVRALEGDVSLSDLNEGIRPGQRTVYSSYGSSDYDTTQYNEHIRKFRKMSLKSQECGSSDQYSNPTSKYGLYSSGSSSEGQQTREMEMGKMQRHSKGFSGRYLFQCINSNQPILWHPFHVV